ncbi:MAG: MFS transporter [Chloroflexi bacterium]|nr:MFS transporter [Chloroflexota bacterium]
MEPGRLGHHGGCDGLPPIVLAHFAPGFITALLRSPTNPLSDSLIASMAVRRRLSFGRMRMWGSLGFALVTIIGGYVWVQTGYRPMFAAALLLALPAIYFAGKLEGGPVVNSQNRGPVLDLLRDPGLLTLFIISFLMGAALLSTYIFGGIYMQQMSGNEFMIGLLFGLSALIEVPVMHVSSDIITRLTAVRTFLAVAGCFCAIIGWLRPGYFGRFVDSRRGGERRRLCPVFVTLVRLIDERAPDEWKSTAQAISSACFMGLSPLLTSALSGYVFDTWGGHMLYVGAFYWQ